MQKDLFGAAPAMALADSITPKMSFLDRYRMSLRLDQALFLLIGLLVIYVLVFSFGVETGKRYAQAELRSERMKRERMVEELRDKVFASLATQTAIADAGALPPISQLQQAVQSKIDVDAPASSTALVAETPAAAAEASTPAGKFTIQIMTISSKAAAEKEVKRLTENGMKGFIIPRGKMQEICIDGFESREKASKTMKEWKTEGSIPTDAYVRPLAA